MSESDSESIDGSVKSVHAVKGLTLSLISTTIVASLSLVLVRETDDRQCRLFYFMCTYRKIYNLYYVKCIMPTHIASEQLVLCYIGLLSYIILLYNFISLTGLTGLVEVISTCSRQPKLITC